MSELTKFLEYFSTSVVDAYIDEPDQVRLYIQPKGHTFLPKLAKQVEQYFFENGVFFDYFFVSIIPYFEGKVNQELLLETIQQTRAADLLHFVEIDSPYYYSLFSSINSQHDEEQIFKEPEKPSILHGEITHFQEFEATLGQRLFKSSQDFPLHCIHFIDHHGTYSSIEYQELLQRALSTLTQLNQLGIQQHDVLVLMLEASVEMTIIMWACFLGGIVVFPVPILNEAIQESNFLKNLPHLAKEIGKLNIIASHADLIVVREAIERDKQCIHVPTKAILLQTVLETAEPANVPMIQPLQRALILMTSGSTGVPKLVVHAHRSLIARSINNIRFHGFSPKDTSLNWFGFDHVGALVMFHIHDMVLGAPQFHVNTRYILQSPLTWLSLIQKHQITMTWAPNFAFLLILHELERHPTFEVDLSRLHFILNGGESIDYAVIKKTADVWSERFRLGRNVIHPAWGMSETASGVVYSQTLIPSYSMNGLLYTNLGMPIPDCSLRILLKNGTIAPFGVPGALQIKGPMLMLGYLHHLNNEESSFGDDGWFDTGDIACITLEGLVILGRERDIIIINGANHSISDLESTILFQVQGIIPGCLSVLPLYSQLTAQIELIVLVSLMTDVRGDQIYNEINRVILSKLGITTSHILKISAELFPKSTIGKIKKNDLQKQFLTGCYNSALLDHHSSSSEYLQQIDIKQWVQVPFPSLNIQPTRFKTILVVMDLDRMQHFHHVLKQIKHSSEKLIISSVQTLTERLVPIFSDYIAIEKVIILDTDAIPSDKVLFEYFADTFAGLFWLASQVGLHQSSMTCVFHYLRVIDIPLDQVDSDYIATTKIAFLKSVVKEYAHIQMNASYVERQNLVDPALITQILHYHMDNIMFFSANCLYKLMLEKIHPKLPLHPIELFSNDYFHVVVGGFGGLGYEITQCLIQKGTQSILILGAKESQEIDQFAHRMRVLTAAAGTHVFYEPVDISKPNDVQVVLARYIKQFAKPLGKVLNLAGHFHEASIHDESIDYIRRLMEPKVLGSINLLRVCQHNPGSELILFSSINGFFGGAGVAAYAIANAFQQALIGQHLPVKVLAWSMWKQLGMSAGVDDELTLANGFHVLNKWQGIFTLFYCMSLPYQYQVIGLNHNSRQIGQFINNAVNLLHYDAHDDQVSTEANILTLNLYHFPNQKCYSWLEIIQEMKRIWITALNLEQIHIDDNFFDIGARSIVIPKIQIELKKVFSINVPAIALYYWSTINFLAQHLISHEEVKITTLPAAETTFEDALC